MILKIKRLLATLLYIPLLYLYRKSENRGEIDEDVDLWCRELHIPKHNNRNLVLLLLLRPQFRNLFFYRIKSHSSILKRICKPDATLTIASDCEHIIGGVFISSMRQERISPLNRLAKDVYSAI